MPSAFAQWEIINPKPVGADYLVGEFKGKMGMIHRNQATFIDFKYDVIETDFYDENKILILHNGETHQVVDEWGKVITPKYQDVEWISDKDFIVRYKDENEKIYYGTMDIEGNFGITINMGYEFLEKIPNHNLLIAEQFSWVGSKTKGVIDFNNRTVISFEKYKNIQYLSDAKLFIVQDFEDLYGIIDLKDNQIIPIKYGEIKYNSDEKIFKAKEIIIHSNLSYKTYKLNEENNYNEENNFTEMNEVDFKEIYFDKDGKILENVKGSLDFSDKNSNSLKKENNKKSFSIPNWVYMTLMIILVCFLIWFIPYKINKMREQAWLESE